MALKGAHKREDGKWRAQIWVHGRAIYLGDFDTEEEAHKAYLTGKKNLHALTREPGKPGGAISDLTVEERIQRAVDKNRI